MFNFNEFKTLVNELYTELIDNNDSKVADYIPQLQKMLIQTYLK